MFCYYLPAVLTSSPFLFHAPWDLVSVSLKSVRSSNSLSGSERRTRDEKHLSVAQYRVSHHRCGVGRQWSRWWSLVLSLHASDFHQIRFNVWPRTNCNTCRVRRYLISIHEHLAAKGCFVNDFHFPHFSPHTLHTLSLTLLPSTLPMKNPSFIFRLTGVRGLSCEKKWKWELVNGNDHHVMSQE